jgi:hypothetical protein
MKKCRYTCDNCGLEFVGPKNGASCPECNSDIFSTIVELGLWYMLGDSLGLFGGEEVVEESSSFLDETDELDIDVDESLDDYGIDDMDDYENDI